MLVREIMSAPAVSVRPEDGLEDALRIMAERRISALPVVDESGAVVGTVAEVDLVRHLLEPDWRAHEIHADKARPLANEVREIMQDPTTTTESTDVSDLMGSLAGEAHQSLPVVRDGRLVGVVSPGDVLRALWRDDHDLIGDVRSSFHDYGQDQWDISVERGVVTLTPLSEDRDEDLAYSIAHAVLGVRRVRIHQPSRG